MRSMQAIKLVAGAALALVGAVAVISEASAQDPAVRVSSATINPGATGSVTVSALDIDAPGLGAWEIGITYDTSVVSAVNCTPQNGSVCNEDFATNRVQVVGASASGLDGDTPLASISFRCNAGGATDLNIVIDEFADATTGAPQSIGPVIKAGLINCEEGSGLPGSPTSPTAAPGDEEEPVSGLPDTGGGGPSGSGPNWLIATLAALGLVTIGAFAAARLFALRAGDRE